MRDVMVNFRATEAEREALDRAAARCGMTRTDWLREVALAAAGESALVRDLERARKRAARLERR